MSVGAEKLAASSLDKGAPGRMRLFRCVEIPEMNLLLPYFCQRAEAMPSNKSDAAWQVSLWSRSVPCVLPNSTVAQVYPSVVSAIMVCMVNMHRPFACLHRPDHPMHAECVRSQGDENVAFPVRPARRPASFLKVPVMLGERVFEMMKRTLFPCQHTGFGIVGEAFV